MDYGCNKSRNHSIATHIRNAFALQPFVFGLFCCMYLCSTFATGQTFARSGKSYQVGPNPTAITVADLNDDGYPDMVTANTGAMSDPRQERPANDEVSVLMSKDSLDYEALPPLRTDFAPYALAIANVDALKAPDIVVACFMAVHHHDLSLFRNMGANVFEPHYFKVPNEKLTYNRMYNSNQEPVFTTPGLTSVVLADFNKDSLRDAVAAGWSSDLFAFFPGTADTYFGDPKIIPASGGPRDIKAGDIDGDGNLDLVASLYCSNEIGIWKGDGQGGFEPAARFETRGHLPNKIQIADMNRDGHPDIVVSHCHADDSIVIFYGGGKFDFGLSQEIDLGTKREVVECEIRDIVVTDFNHDDRPDIAAACYTSAQVVVLMNEGGLPAPPLVFKTETYTFDGAKPRALAAADFNKDEAMDLAVALSGENKVELLAGKARPVREPEPKPKPARESTKKKKE